MSKYTRVKEAQVGFAVHVATVAAGGIQGVRKGIHLGC